MIFLHKIRPKMSRLLPVLWAFHPDRFPGPSPHVFPARPRSGPLFRGQDFAVYIQAEAVVPWSLQAGNWWSLLPAGCGPVLLLPPWSYKVLCNPFRFRWISLSCFIQVQTDPHHCKINLPTLKICDSLCQNATDLPVMIIKIVDPFISREIPVTLRTACRPPQLPLRWEEGSPLNFPVV